MNQLHLRIEKPAFGGYGLAFDNGKAVFVEKAVPGDVLSAEIYIQKKNYAIAKIESILSPSPERVEPQCSAFNECGGCAYLCVPYETEIKYKAAVIEDSLKHIAGISIPKMDIITGERFRYRSHAGIKTDGRSCGFFRKGSNILSPFPPDGCLLLSEKLLPLVRPRRDAKEFFIAFGALGTSGGVIKEEELGIVYEREIGNFFQANIFLRAAMLERAAAYACLSKKDSLPTGCRSAERAQDVQKTRSFLDIGCGVGFFSLYMAAAAKAGHGVDINKKSIAMARRNAAANNISNVSFQAAAAAEINPARHECDVVFIDPPRAGLDKKSRRTVNAIKPERIVYISCSPPTFARDAADFIKGGYALDSLTFIDMFPCTQHIELISLFTRR